MASKNQRTSFRVEAETTNVLGKFNPGTGAYWCRTRNKKISGHKKGHTPGSAKGGRCQADSLKRYMAKVSRSYKHRNYDAWCEWTLKNMER